ncbi:MAG: ornithine carbamoyltransferase [Thermoproteota archaeon]
MKKDLLSVLDLNPEELKKIFELAKVLKDETKLKKKVREDLKGKTLALLFEKPSTRTRVSFEVAMYLLGGNSLYLSANELQLSRGETIGDTAKVLSRYVDAIAARVFSHDSLVELAKNSSIPVINALSNLEHPCQAISDMFTIQEIKGKTTGLKIAYVGDGNNVANSLMLAGSMLGMEVALCTPVGYEPNKELLKKALEIANNQGGKLLILHDPLEAVREADVIYTDVWVSMGFEREREERRRIFSNYQVNSYLLGKAKEDAIFMHCLPAHRNEEVTDDVIDGPHSVVFQQSENKLYVQEAILKLLIP